MRHIPNGITRFNQIQRLDENAPYISTNSKEQLTRLFKRLADTDCYSQTYLCVRGFEWYYYSYLNNVDSYDEDYCVNLLILLAHRIALTVS